MPSLGLNLNFPPCHHPPQSWLVGDPKYQERQAVGCDSLRLDGVDSPWSKVRPSHCRLGSSTTPRDKSLWSEKKSPLRRWSTLLSYNATLKTIRRFGSITLRECKIVYLGLTTLVLCDTLRLSVSI